MNKSKPVPRYMQLDYIDNCIEQNLLWINGKSVHKNNECVQDFSCCYPDLLSSQERRYKLGFEKLETLTARRMKVLEVK